MIDRNAMIAKVETILGQFDRGNSRRTAGGSVNNDLAREIVQRLQTDGDLKPSADPAPGANDAGVAPDMELTREHIR